MKEATHLAINDLIDWARSIVSPEKEAALRRHLDRDCPKCSRILALWQQVAGIARTEASYEPPESAVRSVKSLYALHRPPQQAAPLEKVARLIYDSFRQPLPAGVRSAVRSSRQVVYRTGSFVLDLRVEAQPGSNRLCLVGQVLHQADPLKGVNDLPVVIIKEENNVAQTTTNAFGEFQLEFEADKTNRLAVVLNAKRAIVVPSTGLRVQSGKVLGGPRRKNMKRIKNKEGSKSKVNKGRS